MVLCMCTVQINTTALGKQWPWFFQCSFFENFWSYIGRTFLFLRLQSCFQTFLRKMGNYQKHCNIDAKSMNITEDIQEFQEQWVKQCLLLFAKKELAKDEMKNIITFTKYFIILRLRHCSSSRSTNSDFLIIRLRHCGSSL